MRHIAAGAVAGCSQAAVAAAAAWEGAVAAAAAWRRCPALSGRGRPRRSSAAGAQLPRGQLSWRSSENLASSKLLSEKQLTADAAGTGASVVDTAAAVVADCCLRDIDAVVVDVAGIGSGAAETACQTHIHCQPLHCSAE